MQRPARILVCLLAVVAAACSPPSGRPEAVRSQDVDLRRETHTVEGRVPRAATLETLLKQHEIQPGLVASLTGAVRTVFNPRNLQADRAFRLTRTLDGLVREFQYQIDATRFLRVVLLESGAGGEPAFEAAVVPYPREVALEAVTAEITREHPSLIQAFDAAGENVQLPLHLADIFSGDIDFNSELQRGDSASVLFERIRREGEFVGYGDVKAAVLDHEGRHYVGIPFQGPNGKLGWYDEQGRSLKRQFLKSPLPLDTRVTSRFSKRRLHPVFGDFRAHLGVDYAAPVGTGVVAVAAGTVESAGWNGNSGRMVTVRHAGGYQTSYLHLSSVASGIRPGVHVTQGQLLGRVGMTGAATGPHLDYRVRKNGAYMNPVLVHSRMPPGEPLAAESLAAFHEARDRALQVLQDLTTNGTK